jgi:hypothetical protein
MRSKNLLLAAATLLTAQPILAAVTDQEFEELRQQLAALSERLERLAAENTELRRSQDQAVRGDHADTSRDESWHDRISIKGDLRTRYEAIDEDGEVNRGRGRYRARVGLSAEVTDDVKVVAEFASGADNPVSRNQTFDGGFTTKAFGLDVIYVDWSINDSLNLVAGKMTNPLFRPGGTPLIWDSDLNPEGLVLKFGSGMFFGSLAQFSVEERSSSGDSLLRVVQGGLKLGFADAGQLTAGLGYYDYTDTVGNEPFYDGSPRGNTVDAQGNLLFDYNEIEIFAQFDTEFGDLPFSVFADYVENIEVDLNDAGYSFGFKAGKANAPGKWEAGWTYQDIEADAVVATFNDSDFGGGGTDATGHIFKGKYALRDNISLAGSLFINEIEENAGTPHDYSRLQLDVEFKFH